MQRVKVSLSLTMVLVASGSACKRLPTSDSETEVARGKIATGLEPFVGSFASLRISIDEKRGSECSAVVVGPRHIVSAAHCVERARAIEVIRYDHRLKEQSFKAQSWHMHPAWFSKKKSPGAESAQADLAVIVLSSVTRPPFAKFNAAKESNLSDAIYVGSGLFEGNKNDSKVRYAKDVDAFRLRFRPDGGTWISRGTAILCKGDSGGPLLARDGSLLGIASSVSYEIGQKQDCGNARRAYHADVQESIVWIVCGFAKAGHPLPGFPVPSMESCR